MNKTKRRLLARALVRVKVTHRAIRRDRRLTHKVYDNFIQAVAELYELLDNLNIADLESIE